MSSAGGGWAAPTAASRWARSRRLLYAEALGLQEDGTQAYPPLPIVGEPENGYHILRQPRQETFEQTNPGVY